ncbi:hypothetical protein AVEN_123329-1 [Araneus ventricosus]|uniref:Uncharacterized protein n=1 Tax=Araneus ventricosus TaxID=182803 RepID=A0A4Y1ZVC5_ARAVE|nr:hypothetical protein AVEN_116986-1 [Araneus ventricosus]GBL68950.1 hypothetical protein AVEN_123329-1 [Araneus ventricosus]
MGDIDKMQQKGSCINGLSIGCIITMHGSSSNGEVLILPSANTSEGSRFLLRYAMLFLATSKNDNVRKQWSNRIVQHLYDLLSANIGTLELSL